MHGIHVKDLAFLIPRLRGAEPLRQTKYGYALNQTFLGRSRTMRRERASSWKGVRTVDGYRACLPRAVVPDLFCRQSRTRRSPLTAGGESRQAAMWSVSERQERMVELAEKVPLLLRPTKTAQSNKTCSPPSDRAAHILVDVSSHGAGVICTGTAKE